MTIYTNSKNFQPGLIGPYAGWRPGSSYSSSECCSCTDNSQCCQSGCDIDVSLDLGLTQTIGFDWNSVLSETDDCKIVKSEWFKQKEASVPLIYQNDQLMGNVSSIQISGGIWGGEYTLINQVCTEEGNEYRKVFCIKVQGQVLGSMTHVKPMKPCITPMTNCQTQNHQPSCSTQPQNCKPIEMITDVGCSSTMPVMQDGHPMDLTINHLVHEGIYQNCELYDGDVCCMSFVLISGCASLITSGTTHPVTPEGLTVSNNNCPLGPIVLNVSENSIVHYEIKACE